MCHCCGEKTFFLGAATFLFLLGNLAEKLELFCLEFFDFEFGLTQFAVEKLKHSIR